MILYDSILISCNSFYMKKKPFFLVYNLNYKRENTSIKFVLSEITKSV